MSLTFDQPTALQIKRVELKRELPPKDGKPAKVILKLGVQEGEEKGWVELFSEVDPATWPKEGGTETFILTKPDNPSWAPSARRPGRGGGGGGGFKGRSPADTRAIQRQHSQEMGLRALSLFQRRYTEAEADELRLNVKEWTDFFEKDISA